jgi:hypothetical protein
MRAPDTLPPAVQRDLDAMEAAVAGRPPEPGGDAVLAELAALLAEDRPAPDPGWARQLDASAKQGFAKRSMPPGRARTRRRIPSWFAAPAAGLAACAVIAVAVGLAGSPATRDGSAGSSGGGVVADPSGGSTARDSSGSGSAGASAGSEAAPAPDGDSVTRETAKPPAAPAPSSASGGSTPAITPAIGVPTPPTPGDPRSDRRAARKVQRSATMTLGARRRDLDTVADGVARTTTSLGGFVASSTVSSRRGGSLELRVPAARLDDAIARLSRLGHVRRLERSTLDITAQSVSAKARIASLKAERRSLLRQLSKAITLDQTDRLRARLRGVNRRLEIARAQSRRVENRASYADLSVAVVPEKAASAAPGGWSPRDAWHDALRVLEVAAGIALIAFAVALPLALVGAPAWIASRRVTRRRRERALDIA